MSSSAGGRWPGASRHLRTVRGIGYVVFPASVRSGTPKPATRGENPVKVPRSGVFDTDPVAVD